MESFLTRPPMEASSLASALGVGRGDVVALTGAGGKTTTMYRLARELARAGWRVLVTATTKIFPPEPGQCDRLIMAGDGEELLREVAGASSAGLVILAAAGLIEAGSKLRGIAPELVGRLRAQFDLVLVEADGSARKPLTAPREYEPVIPAAATMVVPVCGADAVGRSLAIEQVHRPERIASLTRLAPGETITPTVVATVVLHPEGNTRGRPAGARVVPLVNKVDTPSRLAAGRAIARELLAHGAREVVLAKVNHEPPVAQVVRAPVAAMVLAAGRATRLGEPKQLLPVDGKPMLQRAIDAARESVVSEVVVVLGHQAERIRAAVDFAGTRVVYNDEYEAGQSTSLRAGLLELQPDIQAAIVLLADQPLVTGWLVDQLVAAYWRSDRPVVVPDYGGLRGNPVLFDRSLFTELAAVQGDQGGREVIQRHRAEVLSVPMDGSLAYLDVDTWDDYRRVAGRTTDDRRPTTDGRR